MEILLKGIHLKDRSSWEQARLIAFTIAQVNSTKKIKPTDIVSFPWDNDEKRSIQGRREDTSVSKEAMEELRKKAKAMEQILKNEKHGS